MITRKLAEHASSLKYDAIPTRLVERLKHCVLDTLGVSIGATSVCNEAKIVCDYVRDLGGKPESRILGFGGRAPAAWAVFANGSLGHMLDYEDTAVGPVHPGRTTIPVALAVAERLGRIGMRFGKQAGHAHRHCGTRQHRHELALTARAGALPAWKLN